jgi:hypothetical protein
MADRTNDTPPGSGSSGARPTGDGDGDGNASLTDRWWFSPVLYFMAGTAVAGFQWEPIRTGVADWLNWLVLAAGLAVLVYGVMSFYRARPR